MAGIVRIHVPAHITGLFSVHPADDPLSAGSRGAGVTLANAITVQIEPAEATSLSINGVETSVPAVEYVINELGTSVRVIANVEVPLGSGFGVSGALALGTAIGINATCETGKSENTLVGLAHAGDVRANTGLGDVVAQHRGGAPIRLEPGAPGFGRLDGIPDRSHVQWLTRGELPTEDILTGDTASIDRAGATALDRLRERPTLDRLLAESVRFSREAGLLTDELETIIGDVEAAGGRAAMAMLGHTVFAFDEDLTRAGYDATTHPMASGGVRIVKSDGSI